LLLAFCLVSAVLADTGDRDRLLPSHGDERKAPRDIDLDVKDNSVSFTSTTKTSGPGNIKNKFTLNLVSKPNFFEAVLESFQKSTDNDSKNKFRIRFSALQEYVETGVAGSGYNPATDTKGFTYLIGGSDVKFTAGSMTADVKKFSGVSNDGVFAVYVTVGSTLFNITNRMVRVIDPSSCKIDVVLNNLDSRYTLPNSRLALIAKVKSKALTKDLSSASSTVEMGSAATARGFFSWDTTVNATVNGTLITDVAVITTPLAAQTNSSDLSDDGLENGENCQLAIYSFDVVRPNKIVWDPEIGVLAYSSDTSSATINTYSMITILLLSMIVAFFNNS
jgi:hypothetical protein